MAPLTLLALQVVISFAAYNVVAWLFVVPRLDALPRERSLVCTTLPLALRHVSATMLAPAITSPALDGAFQRRIAILDLALSALAVLAVIALARVRAFGLVLAWIVHAGGLAVLLYAVFSASRLQAVTLLGVHWYFVALGVPLVLTLHLLSLRTLVRRR